MRPQLEYASPIWHPYLKIQTQQIEKVQGTAARWTRRRWRNTSSVGDMLSELEWASLETRQEQSFLTLFYKIHSGTVYIDKDKYLTTAHGLKQTWASQSHDSQCRRYLAYSDALNNSFFSPELFHIGIFPLLLRLGPRPQMNLRLIFTYAEACVLGMCLASCK